MPSLIAAEARSACAGSSPTRLTSSAPRSPRSADTPSCFASAWRAEPAEIERAMERIEAEATRMGGLVESLLLLARLEELPQAPLGRGRSDRARRARRTGHPRGGARPRGPRPSRRPGAGARRPRAATSSSRQSHPQRRRPYTSSDGDRDHSQLGERTGGDRGPRPRSRTSPRCRRPPVRAILATRGRPKPRTRRRRARSSDRQSDRGGARRRGSRATTPTTAGPCSG